MDLLVVLRPLLVPVLVLAVAGADAFGPGVQILLGVGAAVIGYRWILAPEWPQASPDLVAAVPWAIRAAALIGGLVVLFFAVVFVTALIRPLWDALWETVGYPLWDGVNDAGGLSAAAVLLAVALFLSAALLRLMGYATSPPRGIVAFLVAVGVAVTFAEWGVVPGDHLSEPLIAWYFAGGVLLATALLEAVRPPAAPPAQRARRAARFRYLGLGAAVMTAPMVVVAVALGVIAAREGVSVVDDAGEPLRAEQPTTSPRTLLESDPLDLVWTFMPVLEFHEDQRWAPTDVKEYVDDAVLRLRGGARPRPAPPVGSLPHRCPAGTEPPCYQLTIRCRSAGRPCADARTREARAEIYRDGTTYVRIVDEREAAVPFPPVEPFGDRITILVQYWYFYRYDEWRTRVLAGHLVQRHEADWEAITIGFSDVEPLFVAYSAHCGGSWHPWDEIAVKNTDRPWTHPLVAVAEGSQAMYVEPYAGRPPDWSTCQGLASETVELVSFASNIRERTGDQWQWSPADASLVDERTPPMTFSGTWGAHDRTWLENFKVQPISKRGIGPATPTLQSLWSDPIPTIFCGEAWRNPDGDRQNCS